MTIQTETYTLPAHWAPALITGDYTGLEDDEQAELDAWAEGRGYCVGVEEGDEYFEPFHDARPEVLPWMCLKFIFHTVDHALPV